MKKVILASLLPVLLASSLSSYAGGEGPVTPATPVAPKSITVDGGKINFTGSVMAAPCAVDNSADGQTVKLGQIATNKIA